MLQFFMQICRAADNDPHLGYFSKVIRENLKGIVVINACAYGSANSNRGRILYQYGLIAYGNMCQHRHDQA